MATSAVNGISASGRDRAFFFAMAIGIVAIVFAGFSFNFVMARSSLNSPWWVHVHAISFMAWIALYLTQNFLVYRGVIGGHRTLGWLGLALACWMVPVGIFTVVKTIEAHRVPFFFADSVLLVLDPLNLIVFFAFTISAILMRRHSDWHRRLMLAGTLNLIGPALGRLLPMPLFGIWNVWAVWAAIMVLFVIAISYDRVTRGRVHPAYYWSVAFSTLWVALVLPIAFSPPVVALARSIAA